MSINIRTLAWMPLVKASSAAPVCGSPTYSLQSHRLGRIRGLDLLAVSCHRQHIDEPTPEDGRPEICGCFKSMESTEIVALIAVCL